MNFVGSLTADGQSNNHIGDVINVHFSGKHGQQCVPERSLTVAGTRDSELLSSLYVTDPSNDLQSLKRKKGNRVEGTCEWILTTPQLVKWIDIPDDSSVEPVSRILWLRGRPGQGKSTLAMYITEALTASFKDDSTKALSYFFCDASYATRTTANSILRGLLWHFYTSDPELIPAYARQRYSQLRDKLLRDFDSLWTLFLETVAANASRQFYCIIDALDECGEESRVDILRQIEQTFGTGHGPTNLHFYFSVGLTLTSETILANSKA